MKNISSEIDAIRKDWGNKLLILGHHYQRSSVLKHADELGDSLELARKATAHPEAERIIFCGVHFMAESADILTGPDQAVYMPEPSAGCPMADMADMESVSKIWEQLNSVSNDWLPVVYVNSSAELKAWCGRNGGSTCTSSNAKSVVKWIFSQNKRAFFLPDEHLGRNTAHDLGLSDEEMLVCDPRSENFRSPAVAKAMAGRQVSALSPQSLVKTRLVAWKGFCIVHLAFNAEHVRKVRENLPDAKIVVHPEVPREVVQMVDAHGSTSQIIKYVESAPDNSTIVIGTELNLIQRLAEEHKDRLSIKTLSPSVCANMSKTNEANLLDLLTNWPDQNKINVAAAMAGDARKALSRMLEL
ncbi:quinolinate synthase NadA [Verrucomicrobiota bacterium]